MRIAVVLLALIPAACSPQSAGDVRRFQLRGTVAGHDSSARVVVAHEAVRGLMPAMTMPFEVTGAAPALREGDRIIATLVVAESRSWLEDVRITAGRGSAAGSSRPATGGAAPGVAVPGFELLDQDGRLLTVDRFAGRVVIVTFLYTRCPLPDFCPLMVKHLESVRRRAGEAGLGGRLALLGVTLDPAFDRPAVLHAYGSSVLKGADRFDHWTLATGTADQIDDIARFFSVAYREETGFVTHTLSTAVVGHDGRIIRTFASNSWRPDELFDVVKLAIERLTTTASTRTAAGAARWPAR